MGGFTATSRTFLRPAVLLLGLVGVSGCSRVEVFKNTLRAANNTLMRITDLTQRYEGSPTAGHLEEVEAKVVGACRRLIESADYRIRRENIPLETRIGAVLTVDECQRTVDKTRPELEDLFNRVSTVPAPEL